MKVKDCMCQDVVCVKPETTACEIAKLMNQNHIGCVPVCNENNCVCGIVTDRDILLRTVACNKDSNSVKASDIMSTNICTCTADDEMNVAEEKMANNKVRRLPVCDDNNHVIGILTLGDLAKYDEKLGEEKVCNTIRNICDCNSEKNNG